MNRFFYFLKITGGLIVLLFSVYGFYKASEPLFDYLENQEKPTQTQMEKFSLQLHWIPDVHQVGFWLALDKGIYKNEGLDVTIHPGGLDANPIKEVLGGSADVGQVGGVEQICVAVSEDLPIKAIASIHRETPHALISLSSKPITTPADFAGKTIAVAYGDTAEILLKTYMAKAGIPSSDLKLVPFKFDLTPLLSGQVDAITGFATAQPATIESLGKKPVILSYTSAGVSSYGYTLIASTETMKKKPEQLSKFIKASREGWIYVFSHKEEAVALFKKRFGDAIDEKQAYRELELIKPLMLTNDNRLATWKLDESRVTTVVSFLQEQGQLKKAISAASVYENKYTQ